MERNLENRTKSSFQSVETKDGHLHIYIYIYILTLLLSGGRNLFPLALNLGRLFVTNRMQQQ